MNVSQILSKSYRITNTNAGTFLDGNSTNVLADLNTCYQHRTLDILAVRTDINSFINESTTDLVSTNGLSYGASGYNGEYTFPTDTLRPIRIELSYDGESWKPATIYDINDSNYSEHNEEEINGVFSTESPYVRFERDSYFIRPLKTTAGNISNGIHIWYEQRQSDLTTGSPAFEEALHDILAYDLAELELLMHPAKYDNNWRNDFRNMQEKIQKRFDVFYKNRMKKNFRLNPSKVSYK